MKQGALLLAVFALFAAAVAADGPLPKAPDRKPPAILPPPIGLPTPPASPELDTALEKLRKEREGLDQQRRRLAADRTSGTAKETAAQLKQRLQIAELLQRLKDKNKARAAPAVPTEAYPPGVARPDPLERPASPMAERLTLAQLHFRTRDYTKTLATLGTIERTDLSPRDRVWLDYLKASSLRHQGKWGEATTLYREIANSKEDPFLSETATWQLGFLRWRQETQAQIDALRKRTE